LHFIEKKENGFFHAGIREVKTVNRLAAEKLPFKKYEKNIIGYLIFRHLLVT